MEKILFVMAMVCACSAFADNIAPTNSAGGAARRMLTREDVLRATGGRLLEPNSGKGVFVIASAQDKVELKDIQALANIIQGATMVEIRVVKSSDEMSAATLKKLNAQMGLSVVDVPAKPGLVIAPEEGWAVVNIAPLAVGQDGKLNFTKRVRKEIYRAFGMVAGGCGSSYQGNLLDPIRNPDDLDMYPESDLQMPIDMLQKLPKFCEKFGVRPWRITTYRRAVHEGWAPAPTNEYQKAIWEKAKAEKDQKPSNPIKVNFDPKTAPKVGE